MKSKTKLYILIALSVIMIASLAAGCKIGGQTKEEYLDANNATEWYTYYAGGGTFKNGKEVMEIYYPENSYFICTESTPNGNFKIEREKYNFAGWYYTSLDENGEPLKDANGNYVYSDANKINPADVNAKTTTGGKHSYLIARWSPKAKFEIHLITENDLKVEVEVKENEETKTVTYSSEDVLGTYDFGIENYTTLKEKEHAVTGANATFLYFFADKECTIPVTKVDRPEQQGGEEEVNVKVYAKYIAGVWNVVTTPQGARDMLAEDKGDYYLYTPDGSNKFDCANQSVIYLNSSGCGLNIEGNGVTVENLSFTDTDISSVLSYAIFGRLTSSSSIKNLTLKNVTINTSAKLNHGNIFIFCHGIEEGATLENVAVEDVSLTIALPSNNYILNIQKFTDGNYNGSHWLFGGYNTDDEFVENYNGVYISGANLYIGTTKNNAQPVFDNISKGNKQEEN